MPITPSDPRAMLWNPASSVGGQDSSWLAAKCCRSRNSRADLDFPLCLRADRFLFRAQADPDLLRVCEQQAGELPQYVTPLRPRDLCPFLLCFTCRSCSGRYVLGRCDPDFAKLRARSLLDYVEPCQRPGFRQPLLKMFPLHTSAGVSTLSVVSFKSVSMLRLSFSMLLC